MTHSFKEMVVAPILDFFAIFLMGLLFLVSVIAHMSTDAFIIIEVWLIVILVPLMALKLSVVTIEKAIDKKR